MPDGESADFHIEFAVSSIVYPQNDVSTNCEVRPQACEIVTAAFHSTPEGLATDGISTRAPLTFDRQHLVRYVDQLFARVNVVRNQIYRPTAKGRGIGLDVYEPTGDSIKARPAIVWIHGGSFQVGDKAEMARWATDWARRGYVAVSINYRLLSNPHPSDATILRAANDATNDATVALAWLRSQSKRFRLDLRGFIVAGESAGGAIALNLAYHPRAGAFAPSAVISLAGSIPSTLPPKATGVPALLFYGTKDEIVSPKLLTRDCARIRQSGSECQIHAYGGAGHGLDPFLPNIDTIATHFVLATVFSSSPSNGAPTR